MSRAAQHRQNILVAALRLFRRQGYSGTGLNDILKASGAPKGSLYHYFPGGKEELGAAAVTLAGEQVRSTFEQLSGASTTGPDLVRAFAAKLDGWLSQSGFRDGCPISTIILEVVPASPLITAAARAVFDGWLQVIAQQFEDDGMDRAAAVQMAETCLATIEGGLLLARVSGRSGLVARCLDPILAVRA